MTRDLDPERGVYSISVASEIVGVGVQTLRLYESKGLLEPARSSGGTRRYSPADLARIRRIAALLDAGVNLAGAELVLRLQDENARLRAGLQRRRRIATPAPPARSAPDARAAPSE